MSIPYSPATLATPIINPAIGGYGRPVAYISNSMYNAAPTAMDTSNLITATTASAQTQVLADTIARASRWADRYCFGADAAAKGASLAATLSVESAWLKPLGGELRLICDYKPILEVDGIDVGIDPATTASIGTVSGRCRIGVKTIYVPYLTQFGSQTIGSSTDYGPIGGGYVTGLFYVVWSYWNGYPHFQLASSVAQNATTISVTNNGPNNTVKGVYPGTQLTIYDMTTQATPAVEVVTVESVSGTNITLSSGTAYAHTVPAAPDFIPVTALNEDITLAVIFMTTALIKTRGDNSLVLDEIVEPHITQKVAGDMSEDVASAMELLDPYRVVNKIKR